MSWPYCTALYFCASLAFGCQCCSKWWIWECFGIVHTSRIPPWLGARRVELGVPVAVMVLVTTFVIVAVAIIAASILEAAGDLADPGVFAELLQAECDALSFLVDAEDDGFDFIALLQHRAGVRHLLRPAHVADMQQAVDAFF